MCRVIAYEMFRLDMAWHDLLDIIVREILKYFQKEGWHDGVEMQN